MNKYFIYFFILIVGIGIVYSDADEFAEAKQIINAKTSCSKLTENQLELIGDYFMEQMHSGQAHQAMEQMMGGEGSESLRLMHIAMAKRIYCNDTSGAANYGMMGMMSGGMTKMMGTNMMNFGMMGNYGTGFGYWSFFSILYLILLIGITILVYLWIAKIWKEIKKK